MAKKETAKAEGVVTPEAAPEKKAPPTPKPAAKPDIFTFVKQVGKDEKLAPQARVIVNTLEQMKSTDRESFVKALMGKLQTRQPEGRILTYYQKLLVERGYITIAEQA